MPKALSSVIPGKGSKQSDILYWTNQYTAPQPLIDDILFGKCNVLCTLCYGAYACSESEKAKKKKKQLANESQMINQYKKLWRLQVCKLENCSELAEVCILLNAFFWFMKTNGLQYVLLSGNVLCSTQQLSECLTVLKFNFLH